MSFLQTSSTPLLLARGTAGTIGLLSTVMGLRAILVPGAYAQTHGYITPETSDPKNPFIPICGAHMVGAGLTYLTLAYLKEDRALGICMIATLLLGFLEGKGVLQALPKVEEGKMAAERTEQEAKIKAARNAAYAHWISTGVCVAVGAKLLEASWARV